MHWKTKTRSGRRNVQRYINNNIMVVPNITLSPSGLMLIDVMDL